MKIIYIHTQDISKSSTGINFVFFNALALAQFTKVYLIVLNSSEVDAKVAIMQHFGVEVPENLIIYDFKYKKNAHLRFYRYAIKITNKLADKNTIVITRAIGFLIHVFWFSHIGKRFNVFFELHDFFYDLKRKTGEKINARKRKNSRYERLFLKRTNGVICLNAAYKDVYAEYLPADKIHVFSTGLHNIYKSTVKRKNQAIYVGSFDSEKYAIFEIIKVASLCSDDVYFKIVGAQGDADFKIVMDEVVRLGVQNKVEVIGWSSRAKLDELLLESKVGLLALRNIFNNRYSSPLKMFDYFSHGIPVIAPEFPSLKEFIVDGKEGFFIDWDIQHKEIAKKIEDVVFDDLYFNQLSTNVYNRAESLTWDKRAKKQIVFFEKYLNSKK